MNKFTKYWSHLLLAWAVTLGAVWCEQQNKCETGYSENTKSIVDNTKKRAVEVTNRDDIIDNIKLLINASWWLDTLNNVVDKWSNWLSEDKKRDLPIRKKFIETDIERLKKLIIVTIKNKDANNIIPLKPEQLSFQKEGNNLAWLKNKDLKKFSPISIRLTWTSEDWFISFYEVLVYTDYWEINIVIRPDYSY